MHVLQDSLEEQRNLNDSMKHELNETRTRQLEDSDMSGRLHAAQDEINRLKHILLKTDNANKVRAFSGSALLLCFVHYKEPWGEKLYQFPINEVTPKSARNGNKADPIGDAEPGDVDICAENIHFKTVLDVTWCLYLQTQKAEYERRLRELQEHLQQMIDTAGKVEAQEDELDGARHQLIKLQVQILQQVPFLIFRAARNAQLLTYF